MKSKFLLFVLSFVLCDSICRGQSFTKTTISFADSLMKSSYPMSDPGAVLLIAKDGKEVFEKGYGLASMELAVPDRPKNIFAIGSLTKQFTAVAILQLEERGLLSLSDDIRKYFPDFNTYGNRVTIENLLTHSGGLANMIDIKNFETVDGKKENVVFDVDAPLLFKPGSAWSYSNTGYFLLGLIVQKVSGMSYEEFLRKNIFQPLQMTNTRFGTHEKVVSGLSSGYDPLGTEGFKPTDYYTWDKPYSAGGLTSSVGDLLKWDESLYHGKVIGKPEISKAFANFKLSTEQYANYGYGWAVNNFQGTTFIHHGGQIGGFLSYAIRMPEKHIFIVILSNSTKTSPDRIAIPIALKMCGISVFPVSHPIKLTSKDINEYVGVYLEKKGLNPIDTSEMYRDIHLRNDTIFLQRNGYYMPLICKKRDEFYNEKGTSMVLFHRKADGNVASAEIVELPFGFGPSEILLRTDRQLAPKQVNIVLTSAELQKFVGSFNLSSGVHTIITLEGSSLFVNAVGLGKFQLVPKTKSSFAVKGIDASLEFKSDEKGLIKSYTLTQSGGKMGATKVD